MRRIALACPAFTALVFVACSSSSSSTPPADAGTNDAPAAIAVDPVADWSCLGKVKIPPPTAPSVLFDFSLADPFTQKAVSGATVKTCARADTACASPFETVVSNELGLSAFTALPTGTAGFDGFFEVRIANEVPNLNYQGLLSVRGAYTRLYWGDAQLATLFASSSLVRDPALATLGIEVHDCKETPGGVPCEKGCDPYRPGGVSFTIDVQDPKVVQAYIQSTSGGAVVVATTATTTSALVGQGGFLNVPPGPVVVTAKVAATGQTIGTYPITARAGAMSLLVANAQ